MWPFPSKKTLAKAEVPPPEDIKRTDMPLSDYADEAEVDPILHVPTEIYAAISAIQGQDFQRKTQPLQRADILPISSNMITNPKPGQYVPKEGIFVGDFTLSFPNNTKKIFNVFAAPEDMPDDENNSGNFDHDELMQRLSTLKKWHGFDGLAFLTEVYLFNALRQQQYHGEWVIPPINLLKSTNDQNCLIQHHNTGSFKNTFQPDDTYYWSCQYDPEFHIPIWDIATIDGKTLSFNERHQKAHCRLVRFVPVKTPA